MVDTNGLLRAGAIVSTAVRSASTDKAISELLTQRIRELDAERTNSIKPVAVPVNIMDSWQVKPQGVNVPEILPETALKELVDAAARGLYLYIIAVLAHVPIRDIPIDKAYNGKIALLEAVKNGHEIEARVLLMAKANIEISYDSGPTAGWTPLMHAAAAGNYNIVARLLSSNAKINAKSPVDGKTALVLAVENKHFPVARYLVTQSMLH
jgi:hypothetical protein